MGLLQLEFDQAAVIFKLFLTEICLSVYLHINRWYVDSCLYLAKIILHCSSGRTNLVPQFSWLNPIYLSGKNLRNCPIWAVVLAELASNEQWGALSRSASSWEGKAEAEIWKNPDLCHFWVHNM